MDSPILSEHDALLLLIHCVVHIAGQHIRDLGSL